MSLLDRGHLVTATGNSDTHHLNYNLGGYPRNYVNVATTTRSSSPPRTSRTA